MLPLVALVIAADYASVGPWLLREQWLRLLLALVIAVALRRVLGPTPLPLRWGDVAVSLRLTSKVVVVALAVMVVVALAALMATHLGGVRWPVRPANFHRTDQFLPWLVVAVIWAPLIEEIVYRGIVQAHLRPWTGPWLAIAISGLVFWIYHWVALGRLTSPHHLGAGLLLAWSYERTRSLLTPTLLHALGNLALGTADLVVIRWPQWVDSMYGWS